MWIIPCIHSKHTLIIPFIVLCIFLKLELIPGLTPPGTALLSGYLYWYLIVCFPPNPSLLYDCWFISHRPLFTFPPPPRHLDSAVRFSFPLSTSYCRMPRFPLHPSLFLRLCLWNGFILSSDLLEMSVLQVLGSVVCDAPRFKRAHCWDLSRSLESAALGWLPGIWWWVSVWCLGVTLPNISLPYSDEHYVALFFQQ